MEKLKNSKTENGTLYGAKITGGGSGGTVCVIGRNSLRSSEQILQVKRIKNFDQMIYEIYNQKVNYICYNEFADSDKVQGSNRVYAICV